LSTVLQIQNLSKSYGSIKAAENVSFRVEKGNIYGILGPNGSGKTTILNIITAAVHADTGKYTWFNNMPVVKAIKKIGSIIELPSFYPYLSGENNLKIIADIKECGYKEIENILKQVELFERKDDLFRKYSLGMKQRLGIAATLIGNPEIVILDEPTNGLDPQGIADIRNIILKIAASGRTIILASHLLDEVQKVCTHVSVLKTGQIIFSGTVDQMISSETAVIELASADLGKLLKEITAYKDVISAIKENNLVVVKTNQNCTTEDLNRFLINQGIILNHLALRKKSIESQFLELLKIKK